MGQSGYPRRYLPPGPYDDSRFQLARPLQLERASARILRAHAVSAAKRAREIRRAVKTQPVRNIDNVKVREADQLVGRLAQTAIADIRAQSALMLEPAVDRGALQLQRIHHARRRKTPAG